MPPGKRPNEKAPPSLDKPDFRSISGGWVDHDFLPAELRENLRLLTVGHLEPEAASHFIATCGELAQWMAESRRVITYASERDQLERVADSARDLLLAMRRLGADAIERVDAEQAHPMSGSPNSPIQWPQFARATVAASWPREGLLSISWDLIMALEVTARHAAEKVGNAAESRQSPDTQAADALARMVVDAYIRHFGTKPPPDQHGWFVAFVARLGENFGFNSGPKPVRRAIEEARVTPSG